MKYRPHPLLGNRMLPVEIVFAPAWWHRHEGIVFDADFYFHPAKRVEAERQDGAGPLQPLGTLRAGRRSRQDAARWWAGASGGRLYCSRRCSAARSNMSPDGPPLVRPANRENLEVAPEAAFQSDAYRRWDSLCDALKAKHGGLVGDINWGGVLNLGLDLRGQNLFIDMFDRPDEVSRFFQGIAAVIERFTDTCCAADRLDVDLDESNRAVAIPAGLSAFGMFAGDDFDGRLTSGF